MKGHTSFVICLALDHGRLVSGSDDCTVRVWNPATLAQRGVCAGHTAPVKCVLSLANVIVSGADDATIRIWDAQTLACLKTIPISTKKGQFAVERMAQGLELYTFWLQPLSV